MMELLHENLPVTLKP